METVENISDPDNIELMHFAEDCPHKNIVESKIDMMNDKIAQNEINNNRLHFDYDKKNRDRHDNLIDKINYTNEKFKDLSEHIKEVKKDVNHLAIQTAADVSTITAKVNQDLSHILKWIKGAFVGIMTLGIGKQLIEGGEFVFGKASDYLEIIFSML
jgi:hypothetical protein